MTQKELQYYTKHINSTIFTLYEAYEKPSQAKIIAYENIIQKMIYDGGYDFMMLSCNTYFFTCAYKVKMKDNSLHGYAYFLRVFTPTKELTIKI